MSNERKKQDKTIVMVIIIMVILGLYFFVFWDPINHLIFGSDDEFVINYNYQNSDEYEAIKVAEHLNYEEMIGIPRFNESFLHEIGKVPNYIDYKVIEFTSKRYETLNDDHWKWGNYDAKAIKIENSTIQYSIEYKAYEYYRYDPEEGIDGYFTGYSPIPKIEIVENNKIHFRFNIENIDNPHLIIALNSSGNFIFLNYTENITINNFSGYMIEMDLSLGFVGGPLYGEGFDNKQLIILDMNYNPIFIFIENSWWVS